ncbi:hypothetical protein [Bacillus thuringiensis]|uniref:hypothetical protein n=1 Tax=Bacillus thuringiensis TaxID=1428 RepID=UPI0021D65DF3|nr:hypothetical protein [Bacillus thuringiensis]MCU7666806.1 hypothetical protein [Bacillus thuringiensis]
MDSQKLVMELNDMFWNLENDQEELAHEMLGLMSENQETVQFDSALQKAFRELNIWSRTEENTGVVLGVVRDLLGFKRNNTHKERN